MATDSDTFTRSPGSALGSTSGGRAWQNLIGQHDIAENSIAQALTSDSLAAVDLGDPYQHNIGVMGPRAHGLGGGPNNNGMSARFNAGGTDGYVVFQIPGQIGLFRMNSSVFTQINGWVSESTDPNETFELKTQLTAIEMLWNGVSKMTATDGTITTGNYGGVFTGAVYGANVLEWSSTFGSGGGSVDTMQFFHSIAHSL